jgi:signal transduction histidine kinase
VARLAHEVRGPVTTLRGLAGTALAHYEGLTDTERRDFLELIRTEADRLERAVEQVALALRLDAGSVRSDVGAHDAVSVVRAVVETEDPGEHPIEVRAGAPVEASFDPSHLTTIVRELIRNAVLYSPGHAPVVVAVRKDGDDATVEVSDRGPGIPRDRREEVFERFARWRPAGYETVPGAGLGLFIARALVTAQGGSISIEDAPGGGTMLTLRLPGVGSRGTGDDDAADL